MPVLETSWVDVIAMRTLLYIIWRWFVPFGEQEAKGGAGLATVIHPLWGAGEKVGPDPSWRNIARGNRHKLQMDVLVREKEKCSPWG